MGLFLLRLTSRSVEMIQGAVFGSEVAAKHDFGSLPISSPFEPEWLEDSVFLWADCTWLNLFCQILILLEIYPKRSLQSGLTRAYCIQCNTLEPDSASMYAHSHHIPQPPHSAGQSFQGTPNLCLGLK